MLEKRMQPIWFSKFSHTATELPFHWQYLSILATTLVTGNNLGSLLKRHYVVPLLIAFIVLKTAIFNMWSSTANYLGLSPFQFRPFSPDNSLHDGCTTLANPTKCLDKKSGVIIFFTRYGELWITSPVICWLTSVRH